MFDLYGSVCPWGQFGIMWHLAANAAIQAGPQPWFSGESGKWSAGSVRFRCRQTFPSAGAFLFQYQSHLMLLSLHSLHKKLLLEHTLQFVRIPYVPVKSREYVFWYRIKNLFKKGLCDILQRCSKWRKIRTFSYLAAVWAMLEYNSCKCFLKHPLNQAFPTFLYSWP